MTVNKQNKPAGEHLLEQAHRAAQLRKDAARLQPQLNSLKQFQALRLTTTHEDLLGSARYSQATRFFLDDLYGAKDFSSRDTQLLRIVPTLVKLLPESALSALAEAVELDALSEGLDQSLAQWFIGKEGSMELLYGEGLVASSHWEERKTQIDLVQGIGNRLDRLVRKPMLGGLLSAMGPVAKAAGLAEMHEFLHRGFHAFKSMGGAQAFVSLIVRRELAIMQALFEGQGLSQAQVQARLLR